jgi:hypothetical protein
VGKRLRSRNGTAQGSSCGNNRLLLSLTQKAYDGNFVSRADALSHPSDVICRRSADRADDSFQLEIDGGFWETRMAAQGRGCVKTKLRRVFEGRFTLPEVAIVDPKPF